MTTSVSSVSSQTTQAAAAQTTQKKSDLSESTKRQLEALGIPVTDGMTEAQAQTKIQEAQRQEAVKTMKVLLKFWTKSAKSWKL